MGFTHVGYFAGRIREADKNEVETGTGMPVTVALMGACERSEECWLVSQAGTGKPIAIFGLVESFHSGIVWMVATNLLMKYPVRLMKISKRVIERWNQKHSLLHNFVDSRNEVHIEWLKHMGFVFNDSGQMLNGVNFWYFYKGEYNV
jgi:hypothetical protein